MIQKKGLSPKTTEREYTATEGTARKPTRTLVAGQASPQPTDAAADCNPGDVQGEGCWWHRTSH